MIKEAFCLENEDEESNVDISFKSMFVLAVATSIDALAIGITFAFLKVNLLLAISMIGIITFVISIIGTKVGNKFGSKYEKKAELAAAEAAKKAEEEAQKKAEEEKKKALAVEINNKFDTLDAEKLRLEQLLQSKPHYDEMLKKAENDEKILHSVKPKYDSFAESRKRYDSALKNCKNAEINRKSAEENLKLKQNVFTEKKSLEGKIATLNEESGKLRAKEDTYRKYFNLTENLIVYESVLQNSEKEISDNRKSYSDTENLKAKAEKFISENSDTEQKIFDAKSKITALKYNSGNAEWRFVEFQNLANNNAKLTNVKAECADLAKSATALNNEYNEQHNIYLMNMAGVLADTLEDEKPCPVCGSLHHPNPAKHSENAPDKDTLDALKARCEVAENAVHKKSNEVTRLETESESAKTNVTEFANALEVDVETLSAEMISQLLSEQKKQLKALETEASDLEKVREQREVCKAEISRFDEKLKKLDLVHTELIRKNADAKSKYNSAKEETENLKAEIKYSSVEELLNAAKACADKAEQIKSEIDLAQSELSNAKSDFDSKLSAENETAKQLKSFESELENKKTELDIVLSENNILECPDFNLLTEDSIKELKREAETFTDSLKKSRATVEACEKSVEGKQREDVLKINELIDSYTSEKEKWDNLYTIGDRSLHNNQNIYNSVEKLKNDDMPSMITVSEQTRRMSEMMEMYGMSNSSTGLGAEGETLVLNMNNDLVQYVLNNDESENTTTICQQLYDLARLANHPLIPEEMTAFVARSNKILSILTK